MTKKSSAAKDDKSNDKRFGFLPGAEQVADPNEPGYKRILRWLGYAALGYVIVVAVMALGTYCVYGSVNAGGVPSIIIALGIGFLNFQTPGNIERVCMHGGIGGLAYYIIFVCTVNFFNS